MIICGKSSLVGGILNACFAYIASNLGRNTILPPARDTKDSQQLACIMTDHTKSV